MNPVDGQRESVASLATSWVGTPYHHMGRVKGAGIDCGTLWLEIYEQAGVTDHVDAPYYPPDWFLHNSDEVYLNVLLRYTKEVAKPQRGDIVLYHFGRRWSHGGIVVEWPTIVHTIYRSGTLIANGETDGLVFGRKRRFFSPWAFRCTNCDIPIYRTDGKWFHQHRFHSCYPDRIDVASPNHEVSA